MNTTPHRINALTPRNRFRFNSLRCLDPNTLASQLDAFESGYLREAVETWDTIEKRDDLLKSVIPKRKKSISRHGWEVIIPRYTDPARQSEAEAHKFALENFYKNLTCTNAIDTNERGAFKLLVRQMMDAVGKRYAVHEIVWNPHHESGLTAEFRFVPLSYFENTTGRLRFLPSDGALEGQPLEPGAWLVTTGEGLMVASSVAWMFKQLTLKDWLAFSQHNGSPGVQGITDAARDSADWNALVDSVSDLISGKAVVTNSSEEIKVLDLSQGSNTPFPGLTERMDRMMAALWRGADLSTLSREHGYGASLQDRETCLLEEDDCELISETLNASVDAWVIRYLFGKEVAPLARVRVLPAPRECSEYDLRVDQFLLTNGAPLSLKETLERYGRQLPEAGDPVLQLNQPTVSTPNSLGSSQGNEAHSSPLIVSENTSIPERLDYATNTLPMHNAQSPLPPSHPFALLQGDWIQLSPLGDFPHGQGIQRVDAESLASMTAQFNSLFARLGRLFVGVPFFIGHPDVPALAREFPDRKAYGWVTALEARPEGLLAQVKWSHEGQSLIQEGHYKFLSPYWEADPVGVEQGRKIFRPKRLISVGLTNQPNIPVLPLANETLPPCCGNRGDETPPLSSTIVVATDRLFPNLARALGEIHTQSLTHDLGHRNSERGRTLARQARIQELVAGKMSVGNTYDQAWTLIKEQHPLLFTS